MSTKAIALVAVLLLGGIGVYIGSSIAQRTEPTPTPTATPTPTPTPRPKVSISPRTPTQIFTEVSTQLKVNRVNVTFFRIWDSDRVQFSTGRGSTFAYNEGEGWKVAYSGEFLPNCDILQKVPEKYKPACHDDATNTTLFQTSSEDNRNYPIADAIQYIGN